MMLECISDMIVSPARSGLYYAHKWDVVLTSCTVRKDEVDDYVEVNGRDFLVIVAVTLYNVFYVFVCFI